jgi:hypothetical protein
MRVALALAALLTTGGSLPRAGVLVPGRSLAGIRLGETPAQVRATLGAFYGECSGCVRPTWYFTYGRWQQSGLAVELVGHRVSGVFTVWDPAGWRARSGLQLGAIEAQVTQLAKPKFTIACPNYTAYASDSGGTRTVYYVFAGKLWGFGLFESGSDPCR